MICRDLVCRDFDPDLYARILTEYGNKSAIFIISIKMSTYKKINNIKHKTQFVIVFIFQSNSLQINVDKSMCQLGNLGLYYTIDISPRGSL